MIYFIIISIINALGVLSCLYIQIKHFDDTKTDSLYYLLIAIGAIIPLVNIFELIIFIIYFITKQGTNMLDKYRERNRAHKRALDHEYKRRIEVLEKALITSGKFKDKHQINNFINGFEVCEKLSESNIPNF